MEIDINEVLSLYKQKVADLEHEIIILTAQCKALAVLIEQNKILKGEEKC